jgi:hypothetical protein
VPLALLALALAAAVLVALGRGALRVAGVGTASGVAGALIIVTYRLMQGPATTDAALEARFYGYLALTAVSAAVAGGLMQAFGGPRGAGSAVAAAAISAVVTTAGFLALNTALGGALTADFAWSIVRPAVALALVALVAVSLVAARSVFSCPIGAFPRA